MPNLLEGLNEEQKQAVCHTNGPLMIVAGAGTGKTTIITKRIAWLIEQNLAKPDEILALTFTEKAALEMEERVDVLVPYGYVDLWIMTFHSFCEKILRENALEIGLSSDFKILDETSQWIFLRKNLDKFNLDYYKPIGNPAKFITALIKHFSRVKDELITSEEYLNYAEKLRLDTDSADFIKSLDENVSKQSKEVIKSQEIARTSEIADAYHTYNNLLIENNYVDFGDLIFWTIKLFKERPAVLEKYRRKFKYLLVDEFQDTNFGQYELIKFLAYPKNNLLIVGDDDQSIFKFRGASISNILQFKSDYPDSKEIVLKNNYRSSQEILDLSYQFIQQNNPNRLEVKLGDKISKKLLSNAENKAFIEHLHYSTLEEEAEKTIEKIIKLKEEDKESTWNDFAILVRANDTASSFANEMEKRGVPYQFMALRGLYSKNIILDIVAYLKIINNLHDNNSFYRILKIPFLNFDNKDIANVILEARRKTESIYEVLKRISTVKNISDNFISQINNLISIIDKHCISFQTKKTSEIFLFVLQDLGFIKYLSSELSKQKKDDLEYLQQFFSKIKNFEIVEVDSSLEKFLELFDLELQAGEEGRLTLNLDEGPDMVRILTVHSAKGLEFKYVFIVNLVDRKFPTTEKKDAIPLPDALVKEILLEGDIHLEEERRLFYVAMTRAKLGLYFTTADDYGGAREKKLSRFMSEMGYKKPENLLPKTRKKASFEIPKKNDEVIKTEYLLPKKFSFTQLSAFANCPLQYKFSHILKIQVPSHASLSFGKTIHNTLYQFCLRFYSNANKIQNDLFGNSLSGKKDNDLTLKDLLLIYEQQWIDEWYESKEQKKKFFEKGKDILKNFYNDFIKEKPMVDLLELNFILPVKDYKIKGAIDRIDKLMDETLEIIDYKVSDSKERLDKDKKMQLMIYQMAAEEIFKKKVSKLTYYFLNDNKKVSFTAKEKQLDDVKLDILDKIEQINQSNFEPTPGFQCQYCDFKGICEFRDI